MAGRSSPTRMPMMLMTTSSSIRVKPRRRRRDLMIGPFKEWSGLADYCNGRAGLATRFGGGRRDSPRRDSAGGSSRPAPRRAGGLQLPPTDYGQLLNQLAIH